MTKRNKKSLFSILLVYQFDRAGKPAAMNQEVCDC